MYLDELQLKLQQFTGILCSLTMIFNTIQLWDSHGRQYAIRHIVQCQEELRRCQFMDEMSHLILSVILCNAPV